MADLQKALNDVYAFLKAQGTCSFDVERGCRYRDDKGRKCAVGYFIPDDKYQSSMERLSASTVDGVYCIPFGLPSDFLDACQRAHDNCAEVSDFQGTLRAAFKSVAEEFNLTLSE